MSWMDIYHLDFIIFNLTHVDLVNFYMDLPQLGLTYINLSSFDVDQSS